MAIRAVGLICRRRSAPAMASPTRGVTEPSAEQIKARAAANAAAGAFYSWSRRPMAERIGILQDAAMLMNDRRGEVIEIAQQETGQRANGFYQRRSSLETFGVLNLPIAKPIPRRRHPAPSPLRRHFGLCAMECADHFGDARDSRPLACGNTVLLKASELCPLTHTWVADLLKAAGVPQGALNVIVNAAVQAQCVGILIRSADQERFLGLAARLRLSQRIILVLPR